VVSLKSMASTSLNEKQHQKDVKNQYKKIILQIEIVSNNRWLAFLSGCGDYSGKTYRVYLDFNNSKYPKYPPSIRFGSIIHHVQISELGEPNQLFYLHLDWKQNKSTPNPLIKIFSLLINLMSAPLPVPWSDEAIDDHWSHHDPTCQCEMIPKPYSILKDMNEKEKKKEYDAFRQRYHQFLQLNYQQGVKYVQPMHEAIQLFTQKVVKHQALFPFHCTKSFHHVAFCRDQGLDAFHQYWRKSWFSKTFLDCLHDPKQPWHTIISQHVTGVYSFDLFSPNFCEILLHEMIAYERHPDLPKRRPNSMNNYGLILNEIGFEPMMDILLEFVLQPIAFHLWKEQWAASSLDHHHTFMVQYKKGEDLNLDMHIDDAEITFNVNLYDQFKGAALAFCGLFVKPSHRQLSLSYLHQLGRCVVHAGAHRHGAMDIEQGERYNLIIWTRSSTYRQSKARELFKRYKPANAKDLPVDQICLSKTHDQDYDERMALLDTHQPKNDSSIL